MNDSNTPQENAGNKNQQTQPEPNVKADKEKFPDWDILPPNQIINPRIKKA